MQEKMLSRLEEVRRLQEESDRRTEIENQAIQLMSQCRFEEADRLLLQIEASVKDSI